MDGSELVVAEHLVEREVVRLAFLRPRFHAVADVGHVDFEERDRAIPGDLGVEVPHETAENPQGLVARFAQQDPLGVAQEFLPARQFVVCELAQFAGGHRLFLGGGLPRQAADARFGREEEGVGEEFGAGEDHGIAPWVLNMRTSVQEDISSGPARPERPATGNTRPLTRCGSLVRSWISV